MAVKYFDIDSIGTVRVTKRSGARSIRLTIAADGQVRVTIPSWSRYQTGIDFVTDRSDWVRNNKPARIQQLQNDSRIGKAHRLLFSSAAIDTPTSRLVGTEIRVIRPTGMAITHPTVQHVAQRAAIRALRSEAESLLPQRLKSLASQFEFNYHSITIKMLKGRWGSCDNTQDIVLNLYLMQLPWQLIDYVLLHELTHTKFLNHGADFWNEFLRHEPAAKRLRKQIRLHKPTLEAKQPVGSHAAVA